MRLYKGKKKNTAKAQRCKINNEVLCCIKHRIHVYIGVYTVYMYEQLHLIELSKDNKMAESSAYVLLVPP